MEKADNFYKKITKTIFIALLMLSAFALIIFHANFFLLVFAGIFFSVLLNFSSNWIVQKTNMKYGLALFLILLILVGLLYLMIILIGPSMAEQAQEMTDALPKSLEGLKERITETSVGRNLFEKLPSDLGALIEDLSLIHISEPTRR